jgi:hypothetical protein
MRCCTESFARWVGQAPDAEAQPGEKIVCIWENAETIVVDEHGVTAEWVEAKGLLRGKR